jgi:hypothetical protein
MLKTYGSVSCGSSRLRDYRCEHMRKIAVQITDHIEAVVDDLQARREDVAKKFSGECLDLRLKMIDKAMETHMITVEILLNAVVTALRQQIFLLPKD